MDCPTLGGPNRRCLEINEIYLGIGDYVEILNASSDTLPLGDYTLRTWLADGSGFIDFDIPAVNIPSGGLVRIQDMDVAFTPSSTLIMTNFNINWTGDTGAAAALLLGATGVDFVSYRNANWLTPPTGTSFSGTAIPNYNLDASIARNRGGIDTNQATDWCHQNPSPNLPNASCLVVNEVFTGTTDWVELYNPSLAPISLTNYDVISYEFGAFDISYNFVPFTLNPGAYVQVVEGAGVNTATTVFTGTNFGWDDVADGAAYLVTEVGTGVDAVRFGLDTSIPSGDAAFVLPNAANVNGGNNRAIARNSSSSDSDQGSDFCDQPATPGTRNYGCNARLALFLSANQFVSLIDSTANPPAPNDYYSYVAGAPAGATGGQWVMGDWDGNGSKTPGVYQTTGAFAGVFFTTNDYGPTARWTTTWFGLFAGVAGNIPVAGRFGAGVNDCLGVMDSQNFPPFGTAFALYFTCSTAGGNPAKTVQWNSILLPDSGGFTGTFQFSAGDFDGNGIDSIACRRGPYVTWTNTNPTVVNGTFPNAQFIGAPVAGTSLFAVGDWDNNALSSFALFYPATGTLYFRNDLTFNSGVYGTEAVGLPLGPVTTVATWKGY